MDDVDEQGFPVWPAAERNKQPILEQLQVLLPKDGGVLLEIASGTGQHALHFAAALPHYQFQASDADAVHLDTLRGKFGSSGLANLLTPLHLDVTKSPWPIQEARAIFNANMVHIAPIETAQALFFGAGRLLPFGGLLITYGPYKRAGRHTHENNERFDVSLKNRNPCWGVRDLDELAEFASLTGLFAREPIEMPANNLLIVWEKLGK